VADTGINRVRFRYLGLTTSAVQWWDDIAGTVTRSIGTGWSGERLLDWTGAGSNIRLYGDNAHHDVTWLASSTGTVSQALRYDPWGTARVAIPSGYSPFRFQGSWYDDTASLSWVVTRWYAPGLGRFISEDTLLGSPSDPPSRQLYAYGQGEPVGRWDPDGRLAYRRGTRWGRYNEADWNESAALLFLVRSSFYVGCFAVGGVVTKVAPWSSEAEPRMCAARPISYSGI
jgi:RHS repeat-associated protein